MMRWAETAHVPLPAAVCDCEARPKVARRRTTARLSASSRHARDADSEGSSPSTPAKKEGRGVEAGGAMIFSLLGACPSNQS